MRSRGVFDPIASGGMQVRAKDPWHGQKARTRIRRVREAVVAVVAVVAVEALARQARVWNLHA